MSTPPTYTLCLDSCEDAIRREQESRYFDGGSSGVRVDKNSLIDVCAELRQARLEIERCNATIEHLDEEGYFYRDERDTLRGALVMLKRELDPHEKNQDLLVLKKAAWITACERVASMDAHRELRDKSTAKVRTVIHALQQDLE